jgi:hypothetical protein
MGYKRLGIGGLIVIENPYIQRSDTPPMSLREENRGRQDQLRIFVTCMPENTGRMLLTQIQNCRFRDTQMRLQNPTWTGLARLNVLKRISQNSNHYVCRNQIEIQTQM